MHFALTSAKKTKNSATVKILLRLGFDLRPRDYESHELSTQPRMRKNYKL